jgi:UDPglucose 6-dehydrogenase
MENSEPLIGFIGQGWIGKNYANNFEERGFKTVRYALEAPYNENKDKIKDCDIVFIAVPTPTTPAGFDASIVESALSLIGSRKIAVIKSTILPGTTKKLQAQYPDIIVLYSPEFLSEATAAHDAANPFSNIVAMSVDDELHQQAAAKVHEVLPLAQYTLTCDSTEGELVKYSHNVSGYVQIVLFNLLYDLANKLEIDWSVVQQALGHDPYVPSRYSKPVHKSGRGAGGGCFIKDFAALKSLFAEKANDPIGMKILAALEEKNLQLLRESGKDENLVRGVYGNG